MAGTAPSKEARAREQLRQLALFHYVTAVLAGLLGVFFAGYAVLGYLLYSGRLVPDDPAARLPGTFAAVFGAVFCLFFLALAAVLPVAGRRLKQHRSRRFCLVVAACACVFTPVGTILGIFTILALMQEPTQALFEAAEAADEA